MEKKEIKPVNVTLYKEVIDNGLTIYILPNSESQNYYMTFVTRFGGKDVEFKPIGGSEFIKVVPGIAHFLEHKVFEQEDGTDPFEFFSRNGASANAGTYLDKTMYEVYGNIEFKENLDYLLDYVQSPYFTNENIEKEKGIIEQEINMNLDVPEFVLNELLRSNVFHKDQMRNALAGSVQDIRSITKKQLDDCYETFYHPSNMYVVVTGNVVPEDVVSIIRKNQANKTFRNASPIQLKEYNEPDDIMKRVEKIKMPVEVPKLNYAIKLKKDAFSFISEKEQANYFNILLDLSLGSTSLFFEEACKEGLLTDSLMFSILPGNQHYLLEIDAETLRPKDLVVKMKKVLSSISVTEEDLKRMKRVLVSKYIYMFDNIVTLNKTIMGDVARYGDYQPDTINMIHRLNLDDMNRVIENFSLNNDAVVTAENTK